MTAKLLTELKMMGSLHFYEELKNKDVDADKLLAQLLKAELEWRSQKRLARRLKTADFPFEREWGQINPAKNPKINFNKLKQYSDGNFLESKKNLCLIGAPGLGKTHSLVSIGRELCRIGYKVLFYTAIELVTELEEAKKENRLSKLMDKIKKIDLLILDELGFVPLSDNGARLLFDVFSKRYENGSIAVSTNLSLPKWVQTFGSIELTNALIDRFTHRCDIYVFEGESYRFQESKSKK